MKATFLLTLAVSTMSDAREFTKEIRIARPTDVVWKALVDPAVVATYHFAPLHRIELKQGGRIIYGTAEQPMISGSVTVCDPPRKLAHTFRFGEPNHPGAGADAETLVTYHLKPDGNDTVLVLTHSGFAADNQTYANITGGWPVILDGLKKSLEGQED